ncbi:MAG: peptidase [Cyanobacteria bacterium J06638_7]
MRGRAGLAPAALGLASVGLAALALPPLLSPQPLTRSAAVDAGQERCPLARSQSPLAAAAEPPEQPLPQQPDPAGADYRHRLRPTPYGWPRLHHWCLWIEPGATEGPAARWDLAWAGAVTTALARWREVLPLTVVGDPQRAQVLVWRRRPPLRGGRASHGRAELQLLVVERGGERALEPRVTVSISPGQRPEAIEATALHELGHAFGLWGHSDDAADAMAAVPGATPVRSLSPRDRATLNWLQQQPGLQLQP